MATPREEWIKQATRIISKMDIKWEEARLIASMEEKQRNQAMRERLEQNGWDVEYAMKIFESDIRRIRVAA